MKHESTQRKERRKKNLNRLNKAEDHVSCLVIENVSHLVLNYGGRLAIGVDRGENDLLPLLLLGSRAAIDAAQRALNQRRHEQNQVEHQQGRFQADQRLQWLGVVGAVTATAAKQAGAGEHTAAETTAESAAEEVSARAETGAAVAESVIIAGKNEKKENVLINGRKKRKKPKKNQCKKWPQWTLKNAKKWPQ